MKRSSWQCIKQIMKREMQIFIHRPIFLFCLVIAPLMCILFFTTLMMDGLPTKLPAGIVNQDNTHITRIISRILDSFEEINVVHNYNSFTEARQAMQRGDIYAFFYIPPHTTAKALQMRQPTISFYTNEAYFVPGTLLMRDMRYGSELSGLALTRQVMWMKGYTERQAMGIIQPICVEAHPLHNPTLNYSVYLTNILMPGILILLIMLTTTYTIGLEWKRESQHTWFRMAGKSVPVALTGKLLPQTLWFFAIVAFNDVYLYGVLQFPCNCGILAMIGVGWLTVLASQSFGVFLFGMFTGMMRFSMCICALWGILSFSLAGFTYPVIGMDEIMEIFAVLFPLRHYYLIYVNQALNGYPIVYVWQSVVALLTFLVLPFLVVRRYRVAFVKYKYIP
jgi:ABC-2 type transport system permease protein